MSRLDTIKNEAKERAEGGFGGVKRKWYTDNEKLEKLGMKQYKAKQATNFLSIIPPEDATKYFGLKVFIHFDIGANHDAYLCPKMMKGEKCILCERREQLKTQEADKELLKAFSCFPPRYLFIVVDRASKETEAIGPQLYDASQGINDEILGLSKDRRTGEVIDISDIDNGRMLVFDRTGKGATSTRYSAFELEKQDPIPDEWLDIPTIEELLHYGTQEEMAASMGLVARDGEPEDAPDPAMTNTPRSRRAASVTPEVKPEVQQPTAPVAEPAPVTAPAPVAAPAAESTRRRRIPRDGAEASVPAPAATTPAAASAEPASAPAEDDIKKRLRERLAARGRK